MLFNGSSDDDALTHDLKPWRKYVILFVGSWMTLSATFSSTSLLAATPEISHDLSTTVTIINVTNAFVLIAMGGSCLIWLPLNNIFGRRRAYNGAIFVMLACSIGTAVAPDMESFTATRLLSGFTATYLMVAGQTIIADIFEPVVRGRAVGIYIAGSVSGPGIGPCVGGVIVTFSSWRVIYWVQVAMAGLGLVLSLLLVPDIPHKLDDGYDTKEEVIPSTRKYIEHFNPSRIFKQFLVRDIILVYLTCGLLSATQYGLLTERGGVRLPKDRLNSGLSTLFGILPISVLLYAWGLQKRFGGLALPLVAAFWVGIGLMGTLSGLYTYTAEVSPRERTEVICGKYVVQYTLAAGSTAAIVPLIDAVGVGWSFTILMVLDLLGGLFILIVTGFTLPWRKSDGREDRS
ncbi:Major facilitator superfamily domain, general substrate transporter [Pleurostoma richardsiae]|uniref:Major facilitator superfamily domain, general substrate transporter n=1 Tax=Pleurostoma richardsiae TaxID=41990 RepID=A0AA38RJV6_9PEZI|nr:Major facilitator superfamily domain, general substrate transporter [Pleurostoma richardsiae]